MDEARFQIAGLVFGLKVVGRRREFSIPASYQPFIVDSGNVDLFLEAEYRPVPPIEAEPVFDSLGPWRMWRSQGGYIISAHSSEARDKPYQIVTIDEGFSHGRTLISEAVLEGRPSFFPFGYPVDEVLAINRLALGYGIEVHACGLSDNGDGILFLGISGAGKSTMSQIWDSEENVLVLSDDRIIITRKNDTFWIHGTPWHGDAGIADPGGVPLKAVFFIQHAPENKARRLNVMQGATNLLARSFPTFWNRSGMQFSTGMAGDIAGKIPVFELDFTPDSEIVGFVRSLR